MYVEDVQAKLPSFFSGQEAPASTPTMPLRTPSVISLTREQAQDVSTYRRAKAEAPRTGKPLVVAE